MIRVSVGPGLTDRWSVRAIAEEGTEIEEYTQKVRMKGDAPMIAVERAARKLQRLIRKTQ